jgi:putative flavoprotein involved in K+ transport
MQVENVETLIVGGGQAGLAMSEQLSRRGLPHLIVERHRVAERWRSERWDGLHANGPAWHDRLPGLPIAGVADDGFATRSQMVDYFDAYARQIAAPIRCGVAVTMLQKQPGGTGFRAETSHGVIEARNVVVATGPFQQPVIPAIVPPEAGIVQLHSSAYRNPGQLADGAVLVVGAGSSGAQIADELLRAGRRVYLSLGRHQRLPRRYRGHDYCYWMGLFGMWDVAASDPPPRHVTIAVSGTHGGQTIDFRRLAGRGMVLVGHAEGYEDGAMRFAADLAGNLAQGDAAYLSLLDAVDGYASREGLTVPDEPEARTIEPDPPCVTAPLDRLNLREAGVSAIVWATGYRLDFAWMKVDAFNGQGLPVHRRGVAEVPGLYFLGLSWLSRRASSFIFGAGHDAAHLAEHIAGQV